MTQKMAAQNEACCAVEVEQSPVPATQDPPSNIQGAVPEFDFVEEPDQDCLCPVSLELLLDPCQTSCCGQHISKQAADRLIRERKPCPMCKEGGFTAQPDKFFKRKFINTLKVRCPHKQNGCDWVGELGDLNNHSTSCPKRPWKCQYCDLDSTFDIGTNEHTPTCAQYPLPCPNQCEIGTVPRCDAEKHLLVCPLQMVECEFANVGCEVKVPRRDLTRHTTENAQHHLMSATLLNLRLTRELHQKIEEKDQQITELKQQLNEHEVKMIAQREVAEKFQQQTRKIDEKLQEQSKDLKTELQQQSDVNFQQLNKDLDTKLQQQTKDLDAKLQQQTKDLDTKLQQQTKDLDTKLQQQTKDLDTKLQQQTENLYVKLQQQTKDLNAKLHQINIKQAQNLVSNLEQQSKLLVSNFKETAENRDDRITGQLSALEVNLGLGLACQELTLSKYTEWKASGTAWSSDEFYASPQGYKFMLYLCLSDPTNCGPNTHLSLYLFSRKGDYDKDLQWPIKGRMFLVMLNQQENCNHHTLVASFNIEYKNCEHIEDEFFPLADLDYNVRRGTDYVKNNCIKFRIRVETQHV